ncbi:Leucine Rich repeats (2 copies) [Aeoliella mucimassa]|uniref:Leucine Rich repeats (2 copies) n=2 Tax=Aeoliella mucimassa TaxID=2527972 RepID=A0A518ALQ4_9BACT|nr:Leucine Rich repeats (2 copies) [Aeoliella mucimassa]
MNQCPTLKYLDLSGMMGLQVCSSHPLCVHEQVRALILSGSDVDDLSLKQLIDACPNLLHLDIENCAQISCNGLSDVRQLESLETLSIDGKQVSNELIPALSTLPNLKCITLVGPDASDVTLKMLIPLRGVKEIVILGTQVTQSGIKDFRSIRPETTVAYNHEQMH